MTTFGNTKKSGSSKLAPKVKSPSKNSSNFMKENDDKRGGKSPMAPLTGKRLSK